MIVPDINLLVYAYNEAAPWHTAAREWWESRLADEEPVGMPWATMLGFVRLVTHPRVLESPVAPEVALDCEEQCLGVASVRILDPGPRRLAIVRDVDIGYTAELTKGVAEIGFGGLEGHVSNIEFGIHSDDIRMLRLLSARSRESGFESSLKPRLT